MERNTHIYIYIYHYHAKILPIKLYQNGVDVEHVNDILMIFMPYLFHYEILYFHVFSISVNMVIIFITEHISNNEI